MRPSPTASGERIFWLASSPPSAAPPAPPAIAAPTVFQSGGGPRRGMRGAYERGRGCEAPPPPPLPWLRRPFLWWWFFFIVTWFLSGLSGAATYAALRKRAPSWPHPSQTPAGAGRAATAAGHG